MLCINICMGLLLLYPHNPLKFFRNYSFFLGNGAGCWLLNWSKEQEQDTGLTDDVNENIDVGASQLYVYVGKTGLCAFSRWIHLSQGKGKGARRTLYLYALSLMLCEAILIATVLLSVIRNIVYSMYLIFNIIIYCIISIAIATGIEADICCNTHHISALDLVLVYTI